MALPTILSFFILLITALFIAGGMAEGFAGIMATAICFGLGMLSLTTLFELVKRAEVSDQ